MKKILILSFVYEDSLTLGEFELLKNHYNKIIDYFCFPIKYYGVRATEEGETRIDEENQIIWLHTDNLKEYDKQLIYKVVDCFKFIEANNIEYDVIIKGNTSSYLNLILLNNILQNNDENVVYTGQVMYLNNIEINLFARGNCLCLNKEHITCIINENIELIKTNLIESLPIFTNYCVEMSDDIIISKILINKNKLYIKTCGHITFDFHNTIIDPISDIEDVLKVGVTCYKIYKNPLDSAKLYNTDISSIYPDVGILKMIISFVERRYIFEKRLVTACCVWHI